MSGMSTNPDNSLRQRQQSERRRETIKVAMAFFGSDASDRELAQMKKAMNAKDLQLTSLQNEKHKKEEEVSELKKAKETAAYEVSVQADRAYKAEKALSQRITELAEANLRISNLDSSLTTANEKIKAGEKEIQKLQYQLDLLSADSSQSSSKRVHDQEATLKAQIRRLEDDLKRSESEKETIRHEAAAASSGGWGISEASLHARTGTDKARVIEMENQISSLRAENVRLMEEGRVNAAGPLTATSSTFSSDETGSLASSLSHSRTASSVTSSASSRTRRRASSISTIPRLESQIEELRSQVGNSVSAIELENIRSQLAAAKKHANKMENEKMALERKARNDMEELRSKLDDAQDELNFFRAGEDAASSDKAKKHLDGLSAQVTRLEAELDEKSKAVGSLQSQVEALQALEAELREEKEKVESLERRLQSACETQLRTDDKLDLEAKVAALENQLSAKPTTTSDSRDGGSNDRKIRQLQRDLAGLQEELNESDRLLAEKEKEVFALRASLPIPGSPTLHAAAAAVDAEATAQEVARLQAECEVHQQTVSSTREQMDSLLEELQAVRSDAVDKEEALSRVRLVLQEKTDLLEISTFEVMQLRGSVVKLEKEVQEKIVEISSLEKRIAGGDEAALQLAQLRVQYVSACERVTTLEDQLARAAAALANVQATLHNRSHDDEEFDTISAKHAEKESALQQSQEEAAALQAAITELLAASQALESERGEAHRLTLDLEGKLRVSEKEHADSVKSQTRLREQLTDAEGALLALRLDFEAQETLLASASENFSQVETQRDDLLRQNFGISAELNTMQVAVANRSTVSDAQERDVALFRKEQEVEQLQSTIAAHTLEAAEELKLVAFEKEELAKAAEELQLRVGALIQEVSALQAQLTARDATVLSSAAEDSPDAERLLTAIDRLRTERDELRQSLNFAMHQKHFAVEALSIDKQSALNDLGQMKTQHKVMLATKTSLEMEIQTQTSRISALETICAEHAGEMGTLAAEKEEFLLELKMLREGVAGAEVTITQLQGELESTQQGLAAAASLAQQRQQDLEEARATAGEDVRQLLAERMHATTKPNESAARLLKQDLDEQIQRVARRDAQIAAHQAELKRLKLNRDLMTASMEELHQELAEAFKTLSEERQSRTSGSTALAEAHVKIKTLEQGMATAESQATVLMAEISSLQADKAQAVARAEAGSQQGDIVSLAEVAAMSHRLSEATFELSASKSEIDILQRSAAASRALLDSLRQEKSGVESELEALVDELARLETSSQQERHSLQRDLEAARASLGAAEATGSEARAAAESLLAQLSVLKAQQEAARQAAASGSSELDTLRAQLAAKTAAATSLQEEATELQATIDNNQASLEAAQRQISELTEVIIRSNAASAAAATSQEQLKEELRLARVEANQACAENDLHRASLQEAQETAASSLGEQDRLLKALAAAIEEKAVIQATLLTLQAESDASAKDNASSLQDAQSTSLAAEKRSADLATLVDSLETQVKAHAKADEETQSTIKALETAREELINLQTQLATLTDANAELQRVSVAQSATASGLQEEVAAAQKESKQAVGLLKFEESKAKNLSKSLQAAHVDLAAAQKEAADAVAQARSTQISVSKLLAENQKLQEALTAAATPESQDDGGLAERISELEATLNQKMQEVDEADDKVRDAYKANARLEKKIAKLERKLVVAAAPAELPALSGPPSEAAPRATPRPVNVFEPSVPILAGGKRSREEAEVERLPAEAIVQPPAFTPGRTPLSVRRAPTSRLGFTPTRRVSGEAGLKSTTPARTPGARLTFGADITNGLKPVEVPRSDAKPVAVLPRNAFSVIP